MKQKANKIEPMHKFIYERYEQIHYQFWLRAEFQYTRLTLYCNYAIIMQGRIQDFSQEGVHL